MVAERSQPDKPFPSRHIHGYETLNKVNCADGDKRTEFTDLHIDVHPDYDRRLRGNASPPGAAVGEGRIV